MRDAILNGINTFVSHNAQYDTLYDLTDPATRESLADTIADALTAPVNRAPHLDPAHVIAGAVGPLFTGPESPWDILDIEAPADHKAMRQFIFGIQHYFGVRVRSVLDAEDTPRFIYAGRAASITALMLTCVTLSAAAEPHTATMSAAERAEFWATVAQQVTNESDLDGVAERMELDFRGASERLNATYGPTRWLPRATPAATGDIYSAAVEVGAISLPAA